MSLRERRGNFLQPQSKVKRTESYFALPVSLRNNSETALGRILTYGKEALSCLSSRFWEFVNPQVELSVQVRPVEFKVAGNEVENCQKEDGEERVQGKRGSGDWAPACVKKRVVVKESVEVQTEPYVDLKMPKKINLGRNVESCKNADSFGDMDTKGTDDDEDDWFKGKKVRKAKKPKIWIDRQPFLEVIPEKSSEWKTDKKNTCFMEPKKFDSTSQNLSIFSQPSQKEAKLTPQPTSLFAWANKEMQKIEASSSEPLIQIPKTLEPQPASIPLIFPPSPSKPSQLTSLFPSIALPTELNSSPSKPSQLTSLFPSSTLSPVPNSTQSDPKPSDPVPPDQLKTQNTKVPQTEPLNTPESPLNKLTQQLTPNDSNTKSPGVPEPTQLTEIKPSLNQPTNSPGSGFTHQIPVNTVIENVAQNPFLNRSIASTQAASYKFGEVQSSVMPSMPMPSFGVQNAVENFNAKVSDDVEMNSYAPCYEKRNENNFQGMNFAQNGFQMNFTPINLFPVAAPVVGSGLFGGAPSFIGNQNATPQPRSTGFNLGVVSTQNSKRGRK